MSMWTEGLGKPPAVYGERLDRFAGHLVRRWDPSRSKLSAALANGWAGPLPSPSERWLYLGAATGTTASHVADLVGPTGAVYAVERSPRSFVKLLALSRRYPNLLPILADARSPDSYLGLVPPVEGVYVDIAQADQVDIAVTNAQLALRSHGLLLLAFKTASMGRERDAAGHRMQTERRLTVLFDLDESIRLDPFHRRHFLLGGRARPRLFDEPFTPAIGPPGRRQS